MSNKRKESGQIMIFASLMMVLLVGIAAFSINAGYAFYQHSRMQADVDLAAKYVADGGDGTQFLQNRGYDCSAATNCVFNKPPISGIVNTSYGNKPGYVEGFLTQNPKSLFGNILRFPFQISVHAIALHGGSTGAVLLASSPAYPHQAFRWQSHAYGVQFHQEVSAAMAREWARVPEYSAALDRVLGPGALPRLIEELARHAETLRSQARGMVARWLDVCMQRKP